MDEIAQELLNIEDDEEQLRKEAKKIVRKKNFDSQKRSTHIFQHERLLKEIVSIIFIFVYFITLCTSDPLGL